jgi:hypothetical protein
VKSYSFDDDICLEIYLDFKRESDCDLFRLFETIKDCKQIKELKVEGSPNNKLCEYLFSMLSTNQYIESF